MPTNIIARLVDIPNRNIFSAKLTFLHSLIQNIERIEEPLFFNTLIKKRLKDTIQPKMESKGYVMDKNNPDLLVDSPIVVQTRNISSGNSYPYFPSYGQKRIGNGMQVFDRDWLAAGLGYVFTDKIRLELTYMRETTENRNKGQLWLLLFHKF